MVVTSTPKVSRPSRAKRLGALTPTGTAPGRKDPQARSQEPRSRGPVQGPSRSSGRIVVRCGRRAAVGPTPFRETSRDSGRLNKHPIGTQHHRKPCAHTGFGSINGGGGIRTHEARVTRLAVFKTAPFNHSGTPPAGQSSPVQRELPGAPICPLRMRRLVSILVLVPAIRGPAGYRSMRAGAP